jgi:hypothetical protein
MPLCPKRQAVRSARDHRMGPINAIAVNGIIQRLQRILLSLCAIHAATAFLSGTTPTRIVSRDSSVIEQEQTAALRFYSTRSQNAQSTKASQNAQSTKAKLLDILLEKAPRNAATSASLTAEILSVVRELEGQCPTPDSDVGKELAGVWELLWTTQDHSRPESKSPFAWINPLENQSYSNNPGGRSNPVLPREIQDALEQVGIINTSTNASSDSPSPTVRSTQSINLAKREIRNVVGFTLPRAWLQKQQPRASITLMVKFRPTPDDSRMIDVKFQRCRIRISNALIPIDVKIPFGYIGPTGWLRTGYIDEDLRITRGHKGSVFVLSRAAKKLKY